VKTLLLVGLLAFPLLAGDAALDRNALLTAERACNKRLETMFDDPYLLLGMARGVYLDNYGVVLTAEMTLVNAPPITPFRQQVSDAEKAAIRKKKLERLPVLRQAMKEMMVGFAKSMEKLPVSEQVVLAITLLNRGFEDTTGLPAQIVMQGDRKALLSGQMAAIKVREN
jgi:hypothetical protein